MPKLPSHETESPSLARMSTWRQAAMSVYWAVNNVQWTALFIFLLPWQAAQIGGAAYKGTVLGVILLVSALITLPLTPLFGAWSDALRTRWGRRIPLLVVGTLGNVLGLLALAWLASAPPRLWPLLAAVTGVTLTNNLATTPYAALIPDIVPPAQRGSASGWLGVMLQLGTALGGVLGWALPYLGGARGAYLLLVALMLLGMAVTIATVREGAPPVTPPFRWRDFLRSLPAPFRVHDFLWVFLTRLLIAQGIYTVQEFLQYYLHDVVAGGAAVYPYRAFARTLATTAPAATSGVVISILTGAILSSLAAGVLSDRFGRKRLVMCSGLVQAFAALVVVIVGTYQTFLLMGFVLGLGFGAYMAVDWALISDVLPNRATYAKDMGIWFIALSLPQITAAPVAGVLLDTFQHVGHQFGFRSLGYTVIFLLAVVYYLLSTLLVRKVRGVR